MNIFKEAKEKVDKLLEVCQKYLREDTPEKINEEFDEAFKPSEISLSLCYQTNSDFKGMGYSQADNFMPKIFDELDDESEEDIEKENLIEYIQRLIIDYNHLLYCINGYLYKKKQERKSFWKTIIKEFLKSILPWLLAAFPYLIKIIELLKLTEVN